MFGNIDLSAMFLKKQLIEKYTNAVNNSNSLLSKCENIIIKENPDEIKLQMYGVSVEYRHYDNSFSSNLIIAMNTFVDSLNYFLTKELLENKLNKKIVCPETVNDNVITGMQNDKYFHIDTDEWYIVQSFEPKIIVKENAILDYVYTFKNNNYEINYDNFKIYRNELPPDYLCGIYVSLGITPKKTIINSYYR